MVIQEAKPEDAEHILRMTRQMYQELNYGTAFDESAIAGRLKSRFFLTLMGKENTETVGFCTIKITRDEYGGTPMAFLYELYIVPIYRKNGAGGKLLLAMEKELLSLGVDYVELYVHIDNENGYGFWQSQGFSDKYKVLSKRLKQTGV